MSASEDHVKRRLLNVDEYHSMGVAGILKPFSEVSWGHYILRSVPALLHKTIIFF